MQYIYFLAIFGHVWQKPQMQLKYNIQFWSKIEAFIRLKRQASQLAKNHESRSAIGWQI
jgi:hypothetical protein